MDAEADFQRERSDVATSVRPATHRDAERWQGYVDGHAAATVFHRWDWRAILSGAFGHVPHYLIAERQGAVVGVFPLAEVKTWLFGHALVSLPFCSWAGPIADDAVALASLDDAAARLADSLAVDHLEQRGFDRAHETWKHQDMYVCFARDIVEDPDANLLAVPRKQRAMIRKGIKNQLTSATGTVDDFYPLYADNVHRHGTPPCPKRFFEAIVQAFGTSCEILIVRDADGHPVSTALTLFHRNEVFPFYAGDTEAARDLAANDFKYWEVMRRGAARGARRFNYGRSKIGTGSFDFKKNWGFMPTPLSYEYRVKPGGRMPENNPLNPKYRLMIATWKRLPRPVVNFLGPRIVRGLG